MPISGLLREHDGRPRMVVPTPKRVEIIAGLKVALFTSLVCGIIGMSTQPSVDKNLIMFQSISGAFPEGVARELATNSGSTITITRVGSNLTITNSNGDLETISLEELTELLSN